MTAFSAEKIGVLGGTFNPVHNGHLVLAQAAWEHLDLAKVLFVPCALPPHKEPLRLPDARHRLAMVEGAVEPDFRFEVCDLEVRRGGRSYSVDTMRQLREQYPEQDIFFIIGTDTLPELHLWRDIDRLFELCRLTPFARPGTDVLSIAPEDLKLDVQQARRLIRDIVQCHLIDISSSDIRHRLAEGMSIRYLVPDVVEMYIAEHGLYTNG